MPRLLLQLCAQCQKMIALRHEVRLKLGFVDKSGRREIAEENVAVRLPNFANRRFATAKRNVKGLTDYFRNKNSRSSKCANPVYHLTFIRGHELKNASGQGELPLCEPRSLPAR
jgi:hypothetical protein